MIINFILLFYAGRREVEAEKDRFLSIAKEKLMKRQNKKMTEVSKQKISNSELEDSPLNNCTINQSTVTQTKDQSNYSDQRKIMYGCKHCLILSRNNNMT